MNGAAQKYSEPLLLGILLVLVIDVVTAYLINDFILMGVSLVVAGILCVLYQTNRLTQRILLLTPVMIVLYSAGSYLGLYHLRHYDKLVHFYSSLLIAYTVATLFEKKFDTFTAHKRLYKVFLITVMGVAVGVGWEFFEAVMSELLRKDLTNGPLDTAFDLLTDTLGVLSAAVIIDHRRRKK